MNNILAAYQFGMFSWMYFVGSLLAATVALILWQRRVAYGAILLSLMEVAVAVWSLGAAFEAAAPTVAGKLFWSQVHYLGTTLAPLFYFLFTVAYAQQQRWLIRRNIALLAVVPILTNLMAWTNPWHGWLWSNITLTTSGLAIYHRGWYWWFFVAYTYTLLFSGLVTLYITIWRFPVHYQSQIIPLLIGSALPITTNLMYVLRLNLIYGLDLTPLAFLLSGLVLTWAILRFRLFDLIPIARSRLVDTMLDAVLVLDIRQRIADANPAAQALLGQPAKQLIGQPALPMLSHWPNMVQYLTTEVDLRTKIQLTAPARVFDLRVSPLRNRRGRLTGRLLMLHDITEREQLIVNLQTALAQVKTLRGLLPICANCKKIRDDGGYWHTVEEYLRDHSEADFSHGICPDCMQALYADFIKK
ncbi:MAG: hypothetical protein FOGNACKC_03831 [Anaerolineae bacterium]|nr:hypothetical protein [Anaerolineae bacterium]